MSATSARTEIRLTSSPASASGTMAVSRNGTTNGARVAYQLHEPRNPSPLQNGIDADRDDGALDNEDEELDIMDDADDEFPNAVFLGSSSGNSSRSGSPASALIIDREQSKTPSSAAYSRMKRPPSVNYLLNRETIYLTDSVDGEDDDLSSVREGGQRVNLKAAVPDALDSVSEEPASQTDLEVSRTPKKRARSNASPEGRTSRRSVQHMDDDSGQELDDVETGYGRNESPLRYDDLSDEDDDDLTESGSLSSSSRYPTRASRSASAAAKRRRGGAFKRQTPARTKVRSIGGGSSSSNPAVIAASRKRRTLTAVIARGMDTMERRDAYGFFSAPVNTQQFPEYLTVVEHPMDFGTMRIKFQGRMYRTLEQFQHDFELVVNNCMAFNAPDTIYYREADKLATWGRGWFEKESSLAIIPDDESDSSLSLTPRQVSLRPRHQEPPAQQETEYRSQRPQRQLRQRRAATPKPEEVQPSPGYPIRKPIKVSPPYRYYEDGSMAVGSEDEYIPPQDPFTWQTLPPRLSNPITGGQFSTQYVDHANFYGSVNNGRGTPIPLHPLDVVFGGHKGRAYANSVMNFVRDMPHAVCAIAESKLADITRGASTLAVHTVRQIQAESICGGVQSDGVWRGAAKPIPSSGIIEEFGAIGAVDVASTLARVRSQPAPVARAEIARVVASRVDVNALATNHEVGWRSDELHALLGSDVVTQLKLTAAAPPSRVAQVLAENAALFDNCRYNPNEGRKQLLRLRLLAIAQLPDSSQVEPYKFVPMCVNCKATSTGMWRETLGVGRLCESTFRQLSFSYKCAGVVAPSTEHSVCSQ